MIEIKSDDYHDFVYKKGEFVGEFEQMYQKSKEIPWHQDKIENHLEIRIALELVKEFPPFDTICEFGCGLGYYLNTLKNSVNEKCSAIGLDVSQTCCEKAKQIFPDIEFKTLDLTKDNSEIIKKNGLRKGENRLLTFRGLLFCVYPNLRNVIKNITAVSKRGDILLILQNFPPLDSDYMGKDVISGHNDIIDLFSKYFKVIRTIWIEDFSLHITNNWFLGVFKR